jgi:hypothetical protein
MTQDQLKLVFNALKQCNIFAYAGGLGVRATAHTDALAILEKALAQEQEPVAWARYPRYTGKAQLPEIVFKKPDGKDWLELYTHPPQPEQEPVAWMYEEYRDDDQFGWRDEILFTEPPNDPMYFRNITPVYITPTQRTWVGLFDDEIMQIWGGIIKHAPSEVRIKYFARAIESKLKEVNT